MPQKSKNNLGFKKWAESLDFQGITNAWAYGFQESQPQE
jgi:hypothetical protein